MYLNDSNIKKEIKGAKHEPRTTPSPLGYPSVFFFFQFSSPQWISLTYAEPAATTAATTAAAAAVAAVFFFLFLIFHASSSSSSTYYMLHF